MNFRNRGRIITKKSIKFPEIQSSRTIPPLWEADISEIAYIYQNPWRSHEDEQEIRGIIEEKINNSSWINSYPSPSKSTRIIRHISYFSKYIYRRTSRLRNHPPKAQNQKS